MYLSHYQEHINARASLGNSLQYPYSKQLLQDNRKMIDIIKYNKIDMAVIGIDSTCTRINWLDNSEK